MGHFRKKGSVLSRGASQAWYCTHPRPKKRVKRIWFWRWTKTCLGCVWKTNGRGCVQYQARLAPPGSESIDWPVIWGKYHNPACTKDLHHKFKMLKCFARDPFSYWFVQFCKTHRFWPVRYQYHVLLIYVLNCKILCVAFCFSHCVWDWLIAKVYTFLTWLKNLWNLWVRILIILKTVLAIKTQRFWREKNMPGYIFSPLSFSFWTCVWNWHQ